MKIVHWNTHHGGKRTDGVLDTAGFGRALKALNADVYCLNEVEQFDGYGNSDQVRKWAETLGPEWRGWFANLSGVIDGHGQGNAILARVADVQTPILAAKTLYDARVAVELVVNGITIVSTHLDDGSQTNRLVEIVQLFGWEPVRDPKKMILAGDWNALPSALELAPCRTLLKDAWLTPNHTSFNGTGDTKSHRIDAIFSRGMSVLACDVPDTSIGGVFPSDHHPVVATFA